MASTGAVVGLGQEDGRARRFLEAVADALVSGPSLVVLVAYLVLAAKAHLLALDFEHAFWPAGRHVLHGESPYPPATLAALAPRDAFVYPAPAALLMVPFALLPLHVAAALFTCVLLASAPAGLWLVGVRDWRCYSAIFLWGPVLLALQTANITLLLVLGLAVLWRYRDERLASALMAGFVIALKIFLWPMLIWLVATRRYASAVQAALLAAAATVAAWAVLGFAGLSTYVPILRILDRLDERSSPTPIATAMKLGLSQEAARGLGLVIAAGSLAGVFYLARGRRDEQAFAMAIVASLLCSPVAWLHYYALLAVALAIVRPRYDAAWLLPALLVLAPGNPGATWWLPFELAVFTVLMAVVLIRGRSRGSLA